MKTIALQRYYDLRYMTSDGMLASFEQCTMVDSYGNKCISECSKTDALCAYLKSEIFSNENNPGLINKLCIYQMIRKEQAGHLHGLPYLKMKKELRLNENLNAR